MHIYEHSLVLYLQLEHSSEKVFPACSVQFLLLTVILKRMRLDSSYNEFCTVRESEMLKYCSNMFASVERL